MFFNNIALLGLSTPLGLVVIFLLALVFAFEIWMFVSVILNKNITGNARALWILGMILIHPIVAIVYYFTDYKKAD